MLPRLVSVAAAVWCVTVLVTVRAQVPEPSGILIGRVVEADSNAPVSGIAVELSPDPSAPPPSGAPALPATLTDDEGRFVFQRVPAGRYFVSTTAGGNGFEPAGFLVTGAGHLVARYLNGGFGQRRPGGPLTPVVLEHAGVRADLTINVWKPGGIDGTVTDEAGEPVVGVTVAAVQRRLSGELGTGPTVRTDDRGRFHFGTLAPGDYVVLVPQTNVAAGAAAPTGTNALAATARDGRVWVYQSTWHPANASLGNATVVTVRSNEMVPAVDISLAPVPAFSLTGVLSAHGAPVAGITVCAYPPASGDGADVLEIASAVSDVRGRFVMPGVPAGTYRLKVQVPRSATTTPIGPTLAETPGAWAEALVTIDERTADVALSLQGPRQISGRAVFRRSGERMPPAGPLGFTISASPARPRDRFGSSPPGGRIDEEYRLVIRGVAPGDYLLTMPEGPQGWSVESITLGGRDALDASFVVGDDDVGDVEITFTDSPAEIRGAVSGAIETASVFLFPADSSRWPLAHRATRTTRTVRPDAGGQFTLPRVPPGRYLVAAVSEEQAHAWPDPAWLAKVATFATAVSVVSGQSHAVTLTTREVR